MVSLSTHQCHAIGCHEQIGKSFLMCRVHWARLPHQLRREVWKAWKRWPHAPGGPVAPAPAYLDAARKCIEYIKGLEEAKALPCPECGAKMYLHSDFRFICEKWPACTGSHCAHRNGKPMGTPRKAAVKEARIMVHDIFDALWTSGRMQRSEAYAWLRQELKLPEEQCHISMFDESICRRAYKACIAKLESQY